LFSGDGTKLAGTRVGTSLIDSFTVGSGGRLTAAPESPLPAQGLGPFGSEFRPTNPHQLFVSNAHNAGAGTGTVSAFRDSANGTLSPIGSSPFADLQTAPCWVEITHDGQFLFAVNTGSGTISRYSIAPGGALTLLGSTPVGTTPAGSARRPARNGTGNRLRRRSAVVQPAHNRHHLCTNSPSPGSARARSSSGSHTPARLPGRRQTIPYPSTVTPEPDSADTG